jgi:hypothetical protein
MDKEACMDYSTFYVMGCSAVIISFGINFDRDEVVEVDPQILEAASSKCKTRELFEIQLETDVTVDSTLEFVASNMSAAKVNSAFRRYPKSTFDVYSAGSSESVRFILSAFVAWLIGVLILPLIKDLFRATVTLLMYGPFSSDYYSRICLKETFAGNNVEDTDKLRKEDFKFLLLLFPMDLLRLEADREKHVLKAVPVIKKRSCKMNSCLCSDGGDSFI